jgi:uncharacterized Fe-S center protein
MTSPVYFASARARLPKENKISKINALFDAAEFASCVAPGALSAIKVHFGEKGSDAFIRPVFIRQIVDKIKRLEGKPFLTDTNTLYSGSRFNAVDHLQTAIEHGFGYEVTQAPIIISDGLRSNNYRDVSVKLKHFQSIKVASDILDADSLFMISHFKGHEMSGFGGAIKNLAMGCAPACGKKEQHQAGMSVLSSECIRCGICMKICPVSAITLNQKTAVIDRTRCTGCGECMNRCPEHAIEFDWHTELVPFMERMTEYAYGVFSAKKEKVGFITFLLNIVPDCDCVPWSDVPIVPDIGILASKDPVAIDAACFDLVNAQSGLENTHLKNNLKEGCDKFTGIWSNTRADLQLSYGEEIGLGSRNYTLIEI